MELTAKFDLCEIRKDLHKIPEKGLEEKLTQNYLLQVLSMFEGLQVNKVGTGILVEYSYGDGDYQLFRADMDGLPVSEKTSVSFASNHLGWMHACGHDIHMSVLVGLIEKVVRTRPTKNLLFLFQPAEELGVGAKRIIDSGVLAKYPIGSAVALHISPSYDVGQVASKVGTIFAAAQEFDFVVYGIGAHAANPQQGRDALLAGSELVMDLQKLKKNNNRICVGQFLSGNVRNAIADRSVIKGTHRSLDKKDKVELNRKLQKIADEVANKYGVRVKLSFGASTTEVVNNADLYERWRRCLPETIDFVESAVEYTAEDFGELSSVYPGLLFWLGGGKSDLGLHNSEFLPDERAINVGVESLYCLI